MTISSADIGVLQRAAGLLQTNRGLEAEALLRTLPSDAQGHPDALYLRAVCAEKAGRLQEALTLFDAALRLAPGNAGIWNSRSNLLNRTGDPEGAMTAYRRATAIVPGHFEAWLNLGIVAFTSPFTINV